MTSVASIARACLGYVLTTAVALCSLVATSAPAHAARTWDMPLWFKPSVCVQVDESVDPSWHVAHAVQVWRQDSPVWLHLPHRGSQCRGARHIEVEQVAKPNVDWAGITHAEHLPENYNRRTFVTIDLNQVTTADTCFRSWVSTHELGHALGLMHQWDHPESIMSYSAWNTCGVPAQYDYDLLNRTYARHGLPQAR